MSFIDEYDTEGFYDEMFVSAGEPRPGSRLLVDKIISLPPGELGRRLHSAERSFFELGITFNVYGRREGTEKIFPFDIIPRIVEASEWAHIEKGLKQRIHALNVFLQDIYNRFARRGRRPRWRHVWPSGSSPTMSTR